MQRDPHVEYDTPPSEILTGQNVKSSGDILAKVDGMWDMAMAAMARAAMAMCCVCCLDDSDFFEQKSGTSKRYLSHPLVDEWH